jgi:hypothetical protein
VREAKCLIHAAAVLVTVRIAFAQIFGNPSSGSGAACNLIRCPWVAIYPISEEKFFKWRSIIRLVPGQGTDEVLD